MKKMFLVIALVFASFTLAQAKPAKYVGNWTLDKAQSKNLPNYYERIKSQNLVITQDEKQMKFAIAVDIGQAEPDKLNLVFNLDGTETKTESMVRTPNGAIQVPTTLKANVSENGKLQLIITRELQMPSGAFKGITTEDFELSADGKTLTIHRVDDTPRGKVQFDMVFVRN